MEKKGTKILIFIIILALIGGAIYFIVNKDGKTSNEEKIETINNIKYFVYLTDGYDSKYNGTDRLFMKETTTKDELHDGILLTAAFRYAMDPKNDIDTNITPNEYAALEDEIDIKDALIIKGKIVRDAIKVLFGIDYENKGYTNSAFKYTYSYDYVTDMYIRKDSTNSANNDYSILPIIIKNSKKGNTTVSEVAIAYMVKKGDTFEVYSDVDNSELVKSGKQINVTEFTEEELGKLSKFNITCKDIDKNYSFEKIEAVK